MLTKRLNTIVLSAITLASGVFCSCTGSEKEEVFAIMVTDVGGINDQAFNQAAYEDGLMRMEKELKVNVKYIDSTQNADYLSNINKAADQEPKIVWGVGNKLVDAMEESAKNYKDQQYGLIDYTYPTVNPNIISISFKDNESAFLLGYLAASLSKTGKLGFVGGIESDTIDKFEFGFKAGAACWVQENNKDIKVSAQYANSFTDQTKGKDIANKMYADGCDIIYSAAGAVWLGVLESSKEHDLYFMGADRDQTSVDPQHILACSLKNIGNVMFDTSKSIYEQKEQKIIGENRNLGLNDNAVGIAFGSNELITDEVKGKIEELKNKIMSSEFTIPYDRASYNEFVAQLGK